MGVRIYPYNSNVQLSAHFNVREFRCKCGKTHNIYVSDELVSMLETLYAKVKCSKAIISSGHRCATHDRAVLGSGYGPHVGGYAADICFYDKNDKPISTKILSCVAQDLGFKGIANITSDYAWIHLDMKGRIYRGNELYGYSTVTSDFYSYYKLSRDAVKAAIGEVITPTPITKINTKDKSTASFVYSNKYDAKIKELQQILKNKGYAIAVDGYAGPKTYEVCKKFTIERGDFGPLVRWVQERLNNKGFNCGIADGKAGVNTMAAIKSFQKANGLGTGYLGGTDWYHIIK